MSPNNTTHLALRDTVSEKMVRFTKQEILTIQRALNALRVRNELRCISASEDHKRELMKTVEDIHYLETKLTLIEPDSNVTLECPQAICDI